MNTKMKVKVSGVGEEGIEFKEEDNFSGNIEVGPWIQV